MEGVQGDKPSASNRRLRCRTYVITLPLKRNLSVDLNGKFTCRLHSFTALLGSVTHYIFDGHRLPSCLCGNHSWVDRSGREFASGPLWICETALFVSQSISYMVFSKLCFVISLMLFKLHGTYSAFAKSFHWINISITYCFTLATELLQFVGKIEQRLNSFFFFSSVKYPVLLAFLLLDKDLDLFSVFIVHCLCHSWVKMYR